MTLAQNLDGSGGRVVLVCLYLPALFLVLRHPNCRTHRRDEIPQPTPSHCLLGGGYVLSALALPPRASAALSSPCCIRCLGCSP